MKRKIVTIAISVLILGSLAMTFLLAGVIYDQYQDTKQWSTSPLIDEIHNVPPAFASNYIPLDDKLSLEILTDVNSTLDAILKSKGIPLDKMVPYEKIYQEAMILEDSQGLQGIDVMENTYRLGLYLDIEKALVSAYTDPNPEPLQAVSVELDKYMLNEPSPVDELYAQTLRSVAIDYAELQKFSSEALKTLGFKDGTVLDVDINMTQDTTNKFLRQIKENALNKFEHVEKLETLLKSEEWKIIMKNNTSTQKYNRWEESRVILEALSKSNYISIASLNTYSRALAYDASIAITPPVGHIVDPNSPVIFVSHEGKRLSSDDYIKRGSKLTFELDAEFILVDIPYEEPEDPIIEDLPEELPDDSQQEEIDE